MSNKLTLSDITASEALLYKEQLNQAGLIVNQDYTWRYQPVKYNGDWSMYPIEHSQVEFDFADAAVASFYRLKWTK